MLVGEAHEASRGPEDGEKPQALLLAGASMGGVRTTACGCHWGSEVSHSPQSAAMSASSSS
eukprot:7421832-Pyramimonas_sp.AAC.1